MPQIYNLENFTIGRLLHKSRMDLNLQIKDVCVYLKVKESDIISLEEDKWDSGNNHLYRRGLIRSYAKFLRVDQSLIEEKIKELPVESNVANKKHQLLNIGETIDLTPSREMFFNFFLISILLSLIILAINNYQENREDVLNSDEVIERFNKATEIPKPVEEEKPQEQENEEVPPSSDEE